MRPKTDPLDPRLYGVAPVERDVHNGKMWYTMAGVLRSLNISESTLRRHHGELLAKRRVLGPNTFRWDPDEVDAYKAAITPPPTLRKDVPVVARKRAERDQMRFDRLRALMDTKLANYHKGGPHDPR